VVQVQGPRKLCCSELSVIAVNERGKCEKLKNMGIFVQDTGIAPFKKDQPLLLGQLLFWEYFLQL
jgi:hypothetical protein